MSQRRAGSGRGADGSDRPLARSVSNGSIAPLYKRLPRGPHRLAPSEVARHQRMRMHGAMVEAVAANGYAGTSVKQIIGLAGVSRRSFYEQFANKQECFLATFDLIAARGARRVNSAYLAASGEPAERLHASLDACTESVCANTKTAVLAIVEAQTAGAMGLVHLRRASITFERMLCESFARAHADDRLPAPVARAIVGGMHGAISMRLSAGRAREVPELSEDLLDWTLLQRAPGVGRISTVPRTRGPAGSVAAGSLSTNGLLNSTPVAGEELRERLQRSVVELAASEGYEQLSPPQIAEREGVSVEAFYELFGSKEECFLAAFDRLGAELLDLVAEQDMLRTEWLRAMPQALRALLGALAEHPVHAQTIACVAPGAGPNAFARSVGLSRDLAGLLTRDAPYAPSNALITDCVAGAIWHTVRCQVASRQIHLLPALVDALAYVVLAAFAGAETAAEVVIEWRAQMEARGPASI
ncbi:MAG TPA: TetR/AcrR family transcriptional regulator [Solirubrobacteraceae bacterium]|nr:TetR/AcrR family transcriptional regulator [Solirubrobacteraceae bacterium]